MCYNLQDGKYVLIETEQYLLFIDKWAMSYLCNYIISISIYFRFVYINIYYFLRLSIRLVSIDIDSHVKIVIHF